MLVTPVPVSGFGFGIDFAVGITKDKPNVEVRIGLSDIEVFLAILYGELAFNLDIDIPDLDVGCISAVFGRLGEFHFILLVCERNAPGIQVRGDGMLQMGAVWGDLTPIGFGEKPALPPEPSGD